MSTEGTQPGTGAGAGAGADLFCEIIAGRRPATVVASDEVAVSILDIRPVFKGHVLVVPRVHVETLADLADVGPFFERVRAMARAVEEGLQAGGTFVALNNRVSQSVPHLHVHVVPRNRKDGLRGFFWPRTTYASAEEAQSYADLIAKAL
ncbi:HIT family protein [Nonomuraea antimicrobica]|uniref:HIT family protein n=1 Tax=Nonomuraea antimicrobica TaxID=561173 RepID=A0ABP7DSC7_9ACTN